MGEKGSNVPLRNAEEHTCVYHLCRNPIRLSIIDRRSAIDSLKHSIAVAVKSMLSLHSCSYPAGPKAQCTLTQQPILRFYYCSCCRGMHLERLSSHRLKFLPLTETNENKRLPPRYLTSWHKCISDMTSSTYVLATKPGRHVCTGRVKYVVDLCLTVARTGPRNGGAGRSANALGRSEVGEHLPNKSRRNTAAVASRCVKQLRGRERPGDDGDTRRRFRPLGLGQARAAPPEQARSAGHCQGAPRRRNRARRAGENCKKKKKNSHELGQP